MDNFREKADAVADFINETFWLWLVILMVAAMCQSGCATTHTPILLTQEQIKQGTPECIALCASHSRNFLEYRPDGKCVCKGAGQ